MSPTCGIFRLYYPGGPSAEEIAHTPRDIERVAFAASLISAVSYGVVVVLFSQSLFLLLHPMKGRIMWGLVAHTIAMFLCLTISVAVELSDLTLAYVEYRRGGLPEEFIANHGIWEPGEYILVQSSCTLRIVSGAMFPLNQWLADGLLLYRCYIIYAGSSLVIFIFLGYLATLAMGMMRLGWLAFSLGRIEAGYHDPGLPYSLTCVALNVLLTLMIIARLALHSRSIRRALGTSAGVTGAYTTIMIILTEACAPYAIAFSIYLGLRSNDHLDYSNFSVFGFFISPTLVTRFQVIGPLLITIRIATQRAVTSNMTSSSRESDSIRFRSRETSTSNGGALADESPVSSMTHEHRGTLSPLNIGREADVKTQRVSSISPVSDAFFLSFYVTILTHFACYKRTPVGRVEHTGMSGL